MDGLKFGPPCDGASSQQEQDDYICIVKNIPLETSNEALKEAFSVYGNVINTKIDFEPDTGKWVGSVSFKKDMERYNAIQWMDGMVFNGNIIQVYDKDAPPHEDYYKCIVSNIPRMTSNEVLRDAFSIFGKVIKAKIHLDSRTFTSIQTGYVTFKEKKAMENAILRMNGRMLSDSEGEIRLGSDSASSQQDGGYVCIVYNIPPETSNEALKEAFTPFGEVIYAEIDFEPDTGKSMGVGVGSVSFKRKHDRVDAIFWMNGVFFKGHVLEVYEKGVPRKDYYKCTVSNFPLQTTKEELENAFRAFGKVFHAKINVDSRTGESIQNGYVTFEEKKNMENAVLHMNGKLFKGEILKVSPRSSGSDCLSQQEQDDYICIVKNIPPETSNEALKEAFSVYGNVINTKIDFEPDTGKWIGSVSFEKDMERYNAIQWMDCMVFNGNIIQVYDKDAPKQEDYYKCIVSNIPRQTSNEVLRDAFSIFGKVINAKIHLDSRTRNSIQTGYVTFKEKKSMENAILRVNGRMLLFGEILKVSPCSSGSDNNIPMETSIEALDTTFSNTQLDSN